MPDRPTSISLWRALNLGDPLQGAPAVVAIVGAGGKTSVSFRLGFEAARMGRRAVISGTTRFTRGRPMPPLIVGPQATLARRIVEAWAKDPQARQPLVVAGDRDQPNGRLDGIAAETAEAIARLPGLALLALHADGSRARPFKAPASHEPVIPPCATHVVAVVGVDALDQPLDEEHVHRPEAVRAIAAGEACDAALIATVLASPEGGRKAVGDRKFAVVVNKCDLDLPGAKRLARAIRAAGVPRVVVASMRDEPSPVREVLEGR